MARHYSEAPTVFRRHSDQTTLSILFTYFLLAGIYWVAGDSSASIAGRIGPADLFMLGFGAFVVTRSGLRFRIPVVFGPLVTFCFTALLSIVNSLNLNQSLLAFAILSGSTFSFLVIFHVVSGLSDARRIDALRLFVIAGGLLAAFGIYDVLSQSTPLPVVPRPFGYEGTDAGVRGTFRNSGQAGAYYFFLYLVALAVSLAPNQRRSLKPPRLSAFIMPSTIMLAMALLLTAKRAGIIGAVVGTVFLVIRNGPKRTLTPRFIAISASLAMSAAGYLAVVAGSDSIKRRQDFKANQAGDILDEDGFWLMNLGDGLSAFSRFPFLGVGYGGASEHTRTGHEIHSSYAAVLTETGLIGSTAYLILMLSIFLGSARSMSSCGQARHISFLTPAIWLSVMIALVYMTHLRKREFWCMAAILCAIASPSVQKARGFAGRVQLNSDA